jgi:hypothetical protein
MNSPATRRVVMLSTAAVVIAVAVLGWNGCAPSNTGLVEVAYAHVRGDGSLDATKSKNVVTFGGANGLYCFKLTFKPTNVVTTLADDPTAPSQGVGFIKAELRPTPLFTCSNVQDADAVVETGTQTSVNGGQSAGGYAFYVHWTK